MTIRICSHRQLLLPMQSDVLNEQKQTQQQLSNDNDCSSSLSTTTTTTLIYSGLKLHPKPIVPTISMPGVASPLSIVKKLPLPDQHLDNATNNLRQASSISSSNSTMTTASTPSSIRLVTPTGKSSPPFQLTDKSSTNGAFSTSKTYILNPSQSSTTTVTKSSNSSSSSSLLTLIPPGTTSPKIQTLNSVTISSTNDLSTTDKSSTINSNQSVFLSKNRLTLVQPLITNSTSTTSSSSTNSSKIVPANSHFWSQSSQQQQQQQQTSAQATKIYSIPPSSILPTAKVLSRPVQLIPTSDHHHHHHHHHPHITHIQTVKTEKSDSTNSYPISMHFGLSSPTINEKPFATKTFDSSGHQPYIHMQLLTSTSNSESLNSSQQQSVQLAFPTTHVYSSPSSVLISTTQRSMDHNNNHQSTITTPIIREMHTEEKSNDSSTIKTLHQNKVSIKNRTRLPLQPSTQQTSSLTLTTTASITPSSSSTTTTTMNNTTIRQPKKHKLTDDEQISFTEPPKKLIHYEQFTNSRLRPLSKVSIENTTPISLTNSSTTIVDSNNLTKKRYSAETANIAILSRKRRTMKKHHQNSISNENVRQELISDRINPSSSNIVIEQIDDELLKRLSQDFVYIDQQTGIRWIGTKTRPKSISTLVSRFSWKPKINHYEKYSDIIRTNPKRTVPVKTLDTIRQKLTEPWASWRIDRLTNYLSDLTQDEQMTVDQLSDITHRLDIDNPTIRTTIQDLIEANIQRHRCFTDQLNQISNILVNLLDHGNNLRDLSKISTTKRTKER